MILNMANAHTPGGGWKAGAGAQSRCFGERITFTRWLILSASVLVSATRSQNLGASTHLGCYRSAPMRRQATAFCLHQSRTRLLHQRRSIDLGLCTTLAMVKNGWRGGTHPRPSVKLQQCSLSGSTTATTLSCSPHLVVVHFEIRQSTWRRSSRSCLLQTLTPDLNRLRAQDDENGALRSKVATSE